MPFTILEEPDGSPAVPDPTPAAPRGRFEILEEPAPVAAGAEAGPVNTWADIEKAVPAYAVRGLAGLPGLPGDVGQLGTMFSGWANSKLDPILEDKLGLSPGTFQARREDAPKPTNLFDKVDTNAIVKNVVEPITGPLYEAKTVPGQYAGSIAQFGAGAALTPGGPIAKAFQAIVPGIASETAGQLTKGTDLEPWARAGAGIAGSVATSVAQARGATKPLLKAAVAGHTEDDVGRAIDFMVDSRNLPEPVPVSFGEALNHVTSGRAPRVSQVERVVANSEGGQALNDLYAARPGQVRAAGEAQINALADDPLPAGLATLGNREAARNAMAATPEGQALSESVALNAPRTTAEEAGSVIQPGLADVYGRREGMRSALADVDYEAARRSSRDVPVGQRMVDVTRETELPAPVATPSRSAPAALPAPETRSAGGKPVDLSTYMARRGGLALDADAQSYGFDKVNVPGAGKLARKGGRTPDQWAEELVQAGYIHPDDATGVITRDIKDELAEILTRERLGQKTYSMRDADAVAAQSGRSIDAQNAAELDRARSDIVRAHIASGGKATELHPELVDRAAHSLATGAVDDPLTAYERAAIQSVQRDAPSGSVGGSSRPREVTEQIPATVYGQVNANPVVARINKALETAKGDGAKALRAARAALMRPDGELDSSVAGLHNSRMAIADMLSDATRFSNKTKTTQLTGALKSLDEALDQVPEYARARAGFEAASQPLRPFEGALGSVVERDQYGKAFTLPADRAPGKILDGGPSAVRDFLSVAPRDAQLALENHLATRLLDAATDARGNISTDALTRGIRDQADIVRQLPGLQTRMEKIVAARQGMARVETSPIAKIAASDPYSTSSARQGGMLLGEGQGDRYSDVVASSVRQLVKTNPRAAETMVRDYIGDVFQKSIADLKQGPDVYGGAGFAAALIGESGKANAVTKAISELPDGAQRLKGFRKFLDTLQATGYKPVKGSDTAFNAAIQKELGRGGLVSSAIEGAAGMASGAIVGGGAGGGVGAAMGTRRMLSDALTRYRMGSNSEELAAILTDPKAAKVLKDMATAPASKAPILTLRLVYIGKAAASRESEKPANRIR